MPAAPQDASLDLANSVGAFLAWTAHRLHDGPVQRLVAARLLFESALGGTPTDPLGEAAVRALGDAADECRALMWLLEPPPGSSDLAGDVNDLARRGGASARVEIDRDDWDDTAKRLLLRCVHALVVDVVVSGGAVEDVAVRGHPGGAAVVVIEEAVGDAASPRLGAAVVEQLARESGGSCDAVVDGGRRRTTVRLPFAA